MKQNLKKQIQDFLDKYSEWTLKENKIYRSFEFRTFSNAMDFMQEMRPQISSLRHHPEWLNIYNRTEIWLTTHDLNQVSERDIELAIAMENLFKKYKD